MSAIQIVGESLPGMPWEEKPAGCDSVVWRHSANPIIGWNPTPSCARVYNSAVVPWKDGYAGVFRADHKNGARASARRLLQRRRSLGYPRRDD